MSRRIGALGAIGRLMLPVAALLVTGCGGAAPAASSPASSPPAPTLAAAATTAPPNPQPSPTALVTAPPSTPSPTTPPASPEVFTSSRFGYSITLTSDWVLDAYPGTWDGVEVVSGKKGIDWCNDSTPPLDSNVEVGFLPIKAGTSLAAWAAAEAPRAVVSDCTAGDLQPATSLGGHQVILGSVTCPGFFVVNAFLLDARMGVLVEWRSPLGSQTSDQATFLAILRTLKFE
jgi:hypothetical protein